MLAVSATKLGVLLDVGLFNLLEIVNALILWVSNTGDCFVLVVDNSKIVYKDLPVPFAATPNELSPDSLISLATNWGAVKNKLSLSTTASLFASVVVVNAVSDPCIDLPDVVLTKKSMFVLGTDIVWIPPKFNTSNALFCVAVTVEPPTSPVAVAFDELVDVIS